MQHIEATRAALRAAFPTWTATTVHGRLDECAARFGSRPLVLCDDVTLTYDQVAEQSRRLAAGLVAFGVRPGDRVGLLMANYPEFVPLKFAIARAGAIAIPFNFLYKQDDSPTSGRVRLPRTGDDDRVRRAGLPGDARRHRPRLG